MISLMVITGAEYTQQMGGDPAQEADVLELLLTDATPMESTNVSQFDLNVAGINTFTHHNVLQSENMGVCGTHRQCLVG